ncbi:unnamed protein product [Microthlaspi erraticum]|uniref:Arabidopsis retrotransposon Orf1 C-terminal domain-containing protein n=1 Tax=Microthlaspi erraticum TaxID=1685480 RepID=A0A6D2K6B0_9BRAS|nr:unnamed protein product [Microthlaspi erraticum]
MSESDREDIERFREEQRRKQREESLSSESELGNFEIGVNVGREENDDSQGEQEDEVEEVADEPMEEKEEDNDLPMFQEHYDALFSMDFVKTKYPHDKTMKALGMTKDVELVLNNMHLAKFFSHRMESYKELTCEFLASLRYYKYDEEDRADLDQGLGWITFLALGVKRMVTFRQLEILFGFNYGESTQWRFTERELQSVWATISEGEYSSSRSKAAQIRSPVLRVCAQGACQLFLCKEGNRHYQ